MSTLFQRRKEKLYRWMYEFTQKQCTACSLNGCACKDSICAHVEAQALRQGQVFPHTGNALRFIGCQGCVVPPHLRETCTIYICEAAQNAESFDRTTYDRLRRAIARLEWRLMASEEHSKKSAAAPRLRALESGLHTSRKTAFQTS